MNRFANGPLTPALSPSAGEREKESDFLRGRGSSLSPAEGERAGVRGPLLVLSRCA